MRSQRKAQLRLMVLYGSDIARRNAYANQFRCNQYTAHNEAHLDWALDEIYFDQSALAVLFLETYTPDIEHKIAVLAKDLNWCLEWHQFDLRALDRTKLTSSMKVSVRRAYYHARKYIYHTLRKWGRAKR